MRGGKGKGTKGAKGKAGEGGLQQAGISTYFKHVQKANESSDPERGDVEVKRQKTKGGIGIGVGSVGISVGNGEPFVTPATPEQRREQIRNDFYSKVVLPTGQGAAQTDDGPKRSNWTPLEKQVTEAKKLYPNCILMFEVGYKLRFFGDDAKIASQVLRIASFRDHNYLTASVPVVRAGVHILKLVQQGFKVGIVSQTEKAAIKASTNKQGPFQRSLTSIYTRSTISSASFPKGDASLSGVKLSDVSSNNLMCLVEEVAVEEEEEEEEGRERRGGGDQPKKMGKVALVALNVANGDITHHLVRSTWLKSELLSFVLCLRPCEILFTSGSSSMLKKVVEEVVNECNWNRSIGVIRMEERAPTSRDSASTRALCLQVFAEASQQNEAILSTLNAAHFECLAHVIGYLKELRLEGVLNSCSNFAHFREKSRMKLPPFTTKALELFQNSSTGQAEGSLFHLLDKTKSANGSRLLRRWLLNPPQDAEEIEERQNCVSDLIRHDSLRGELDQIFALASDIDTLVGRILNKTALPSEFVKCQLLLQEVGGTLAALQDSKPELSSKLLAACLSWGGSSLFTEIDEVLQVLDVEAARRNDKGKVFLCAGTFPKIHEHLRKIRGIRRDLLDLLPHFQNVLQLSRPIGYKSIQNQGDYLIELPEDFVGVPETWIKVCATKTVCRYQPREVQVLLQELDLASEYLEIESERTWSKFLDDFRPRLKKIRMLIDVVSEVDVLSGFSVLASLGPYVRPRVIPSDAAFISIEEGRHPLLESGMVASSSAVVVPNSTHLASQTVGTDIISGPNMGGKSTYIKQVCLLCLMAHVGCFVPASQMSCSLLDGIFVRMGAEDSILTGQSTFQVELSETSSILKSATQKSLVVLDELGRGTATCDGTAIALATLKHLALGEGDKRPLLLFVTHYEEIVEEVMREHRDKVRCSHVAHLVHEGKRGTDVTYLYKMREGKCAGSFGFSVARNAGIEEKIVRRAMWISSKTKQAGH